MHQSGQRIVGRGRHVELRVIVDVIAGSCTLLDAAMPTAVPVAFVPSRVNPEHCGARLVGADGLKDGALNVREDASVEL